MRRTAVVLLSLSIFLECFSQDETKDWFEFKPRSDYSRSRINMKEWLDVPAGKHGFLQMKEDDLTFADGTPVKFWGVNIASNKPFVEASEADQWSDFIAAHGINAVRFHKFTWDATDGVYSTQLTDDKWKNFDYFCSQLKKKGIYYSWSHIYGHRVRKGDSARLLAYSEVANTRFPWAHINGSTASIVNFAEDLQELNIELTVNMLNHQNPVTGLRYADDPGLAYIEFQNEDNIYWSAIEETLKQTPTYRALLCRKFSAWLKHRYKSQDALEAAWGAGVLPQGESLAKENIYPQPNHALFSYQSEKAWTQKTALPQHITDKAIFLYEEQAKFYARFEKAIRSTGYKGLLVGSCWQAGSGISHLLNLHADYGVGIIDRHNYFGGGTGHTLQKGKIKNTAMVSVPGSGLLSTGFQQVRDRPFFISEWMSLVPTEWIAESSPLIAAYGLGLQGWDASYSFAMDYSHFTATIQSGHGVYNVTSPSHLALYPALVAMVYRNDVAKGSVIADRKVSVSALSKGKLPFYERIEQEADVKRLQSLVPVEALAAGRVVLTFDDKDEKPDIIINNLPESAGKTIKSGTGQLEWNYSDNGYFTINTKGTQGIVGFVPIQQVNFNDFTLQSSNHFAVILATCLDKGKQLINANRILITTIARARNTNMRYNENKTELLEVGEAPVLLEPVMVKVTMKSKRNWKAHVLDHGGNRTGVQVPIQNGKILLDGRKFKTMYYELVSD